MELDPCPCCKGKAAMHPADGWFWVECSHCKTRSDYYACEADAAESWNTRPLSAREQATRDALRLTIRDDGHYFWCPCPGEYDHKYMPHSEAVRICARIQAALAAYREPADETV